MRPPVNGGRMIYMDVTDTCKSSMNTGVQRVTRGIYRGLKQAGESVTPLSWNSKLKSFVALSEEQDGFLRTPFVPNLQENRASHKLLDTTKFGRSAAPRGLLVDLPKLATKGHLLLFPEIFKDERLRWWNSNQRHVSARCAAIFHDAIAWRRPDLTPAANQKGFEEYMLALANFDEVVIPSHESAGDLRTFWHDRNLPGEMPTVTVIPWPADEIFFSPDRVTRILNPFLQPKILCVGSLEPRKNHLTLLKAAEILWEDNFSFELVLVGRTTKSFGAVVLKEVKRLQRRGRSINWRGHIDDAALLAEYDECALTVFPSLIEGFGLPIVESHLRGKPCICGVNGAIGELAWPGYSVMDQADPIALAAAIKKLLQNKRWLEVASSHARIHCFQTWKAYIEKLLRSLWKW